MVTHFNAEVEILAGSGGVFEINADGVLIFSKRKLNRFPEEGEIVNLVNQLSR